MNNVRRTILKQILDELREIEDVLIQVRDAEYDSYENMPENLQESVIGQKLLDNDDNLDEIIRNIEDAINVIDDM